jgi:orotidine-5'-phosphate decarboxylase
MNLLQKLKQKFIKWHNNYFGKKSFEAALKKAEKINKTTNKKVFVVMVNREWEAVPKQDFKKLWHKTPAMKHKTIQEWENNMYEFKRAS